MSRRAAGDVASRTRRRLTGIAGLFLLLAFPLLADTYWIGIANSALVTTVGAVGLMILTGFAGQISLGHAAFLALGAYTAAVLGTHLGWPFWIGVPAGGLVAAAAGLAIGPFALRLRGLHLAIVTVGLMFLVNHVLLAAPSLTGGVAGMSAPAHLWFAEPGSSSAAAGFASTTNVGPVRLGLEHKLYYVFLAVAGLALTCGRNLQRSNTGRAMFAVRDDELAAASLGVDPARYKVIAFGVSSFFGGVAGALFALQQQYITVDPPFDLFLSVEYIAVIVIGGLGSVYGAAAGALVHSAVGPLAQALAGRLPLLSQLSSHQQAMLGLAVVVFAFLAIEPAGLVGIHRRLHARRSVRSNGGVDVGPPSNASTESPAAEE